MGNITLNQLSEELSQLNNEIDLTEQRIEAIQIELDQTEEQIEIIEEEQIEEMRSQIKIAKKTLADKQFVLQDRQELLKARQSYLQTLKGNDHNKTISTFDRDTYLNTEPSSHKKLKVESSTAIALDNDLEIAEDKKVENSKLLKDLREGLKNDTLCVTQEGYLTSDCFTIVCREVEDCPLNQRNEFISKFVNYFRPLLTDEQVNTIEQLPSS